MRTIKLLPILMVLSILAIAAFQVYWLQQAYDREERTLEMRTNFSFREAVRSVQISKLRFDRSGDSTRPFPFMPQQKNDGESRAANPQQKIEGMVDVVMNKVRDSASRTINYDTLFKAFSGRRDRRDRMLQFLFDIDSLQDSIKIVELDSAYQKHLDDQNLDVDFTISKVETKGGKQPAFNEQTLGFRNPVTYRVDIRNRNAFILKRIAIPILFSVFLVAFTALSFTLLFRNLLRQNRLANIKNEFISNITHELKTPIATVSVAIEALKNFNANLDRERTKEYLDISSNELQRLTLLVDKVLKLSMFEKKEIDLQYEVLDMEELVSEVTSSLRLQFEKHNADVSVHSDGDTTLEGDRLHLVSVIFNLLDNAIKYSSDAPNIDVRVSGSDRKVDLIIKDSGIGIPEEYKARIFEKFFRVPTGNLHNAKGYGLGLSYVAHVVNKHHGTINVESVAGGGSKFIITLPKRKS